MRSSKRWKWTCALVPGVVLPGLLLGAMHLPMHSAAAASGSLPAEIQALQNQRQAQLQSMTPQQQAELVQQLAVWDALPRAQREDRRARYQAWLALDPGTREGLHTAAVQFAALPFEQQQALRSKFAGLDASTRNGWRLGPELGAEYEKLYPLLAYVPVDQRVPLLALLRTMTAQQRTDLAVLAQRTPPQERQALRAELLATTPAQRESWLQHRLEQ